MTKIVFFLLALYSLALCESQEYSLGNGFHIPATSAYVGGYFSTEYMNRAKAHQDYYKIDDVALLGYGSYKKISYLVEFEAADFYTKELTNGGQSHLNSDMHAERLYIDYSISEQYQLRVGKFSSPIGYWNLTPINVLRDTTSNPVMSSIIFPKQTTGIDLSYEYLNTHETKADILIQNSDDIDKKYNAIKVDRHYGVGIEINSDYTSLKFNSGYFRSETPLYHDQNFYYGVASFLFDNDTLKVSGEIATQFSDTKSIIPYALYLQSVYTLWEKHYAIVRLESYKIEETTQAQKDNISIFAYTYRPIYPVALKAEYQIHSDTKQNQFIASFSVLF